MAGKITWKLGGEVRARGFQRRFSHNYGEVVSMFNNRDQKTWCGPTVEANNQTNNRILVPIPSFSFHAGQGSRRCCTKCYSFTVVR